MQIPEFSPVLLKEELANVIETIDDNWITEGKKTQGAAKNRTRTSRQTLS